MGGEANNLLRLPGSLVGIQGVHAYTEPLRNIPTATNPLRSWKKKIVLLITDIKHD